jgi:hypothetical protein
MIVILVIIIFLVLYFGSSDKFVEGSNDTYKVYFLTKDYKIDKISAPIDFVMSSEYMFSILKCLDKRLVMINENKIYEMVPDAFEKMPKVLYVHHFDFYYDKHRTPYKCDTINTRKYLEDLGNVFLEFNHTIECVGKNIIKIDKRFKAEFCCLELNLPTRLLVNLSPNIQEVIVYNSKCNSILPNKIYYNDIRLHIEDKYEFSDNKLLVYGIHDVDIKCNKEHEDIWRPIIESQGYRPIHILDFCINYLGYQNEGQAKGILESNHFVLLDKQTVGGYEVLFHGNSEKKDILKPSKYPEFTKPILLASKLYAEAVIFGTKCLNLKAEVRANGIYEMYPNAFRCLDEDSYVHHVSNKDFFMDQKSPMYAQGNEYVSENETIPIQVDKVNALDYLNGCGIPLINYEDYLQSIMHPIVVCEFKCKYWITSCNYNQDFDLYKTLKQDFGHKYSVYLAWWMNFEPKEDCIIVGECFKTDSSIRFIGKRYVINLLKDFSDYSKANLSMYKALDFEPIEYDELVRFL